MTQRVSFDHNYYFMECEEETSAGVQAQAVAPTSTMEASGAMAVSQAGAACSSHASRGTISYATVDEPNVKGHPKQESESDTEDSHDDEDEDDEDEDDLSTSDQDTSDPEQEEAALFVAAAAPPTAPAAAAIQIPGPHRSRHCRRRRHRRRRSTSFHFTQWQVEEMESLFEETPYPDVLTRIELARTLNVPEVKVKVWFSNRRAKQRRIERRAMLRNMPSGAEDFIFMTDVEEPY